MKQTKSKRIDGFEVRHLEAGVHQVRMSTGDAKSAGCASGGAEKAVSDEDPSLPRTEGRSQLSSPSKHHEVFSKFKLRQREVPPGFRVNFLGVRTRNAFFSNDRQYVPDEYPPINEDYFEWIGLLEAVAAAQDNFSMIELGAGYGHWLANAAAALRQSTGLPYQLIGVEAEPTHFQWMKEHLLTNNVDLHRCQLIEAAVNSTDGSTGFHVGDVGFGGPQDWYGQAIGGASTVPAISLTTILANLQRVDLLDIDIQGAELDVIRPATTEVTNKVKRIHIGTHSQGAESGLRALFTDLGWIAINDYSLGGEHLTPWGPTKFQDGVQTWLNPRFLSEEELERLATITVPTALGFNIRAGREDFITKLLREDQIFEAAETDLAIRLLGPGDVCFDVGCHVGYYTCLMASLVGAGGKVYAFDASPRSCDLAEQSLSVNNLHAEILHAAVGDGQGTTPFNVSSDDQSGLSSLGNIPTRARTIVVPWVRLQDFLKERNIERVRLLKIDVEGAEEIVLRGLGDLLKRHVVDYILLEAYDERLKLLNTSTEKVAGLLRAAGYLAWEFGTKAMSGWTRVDHVESRGDCNYLFASPRVREGMPQLSLSRAFVSVAGKARQRLELQRELVERHNQIARLQNDVNIAVDELRTREREVAELQSQTQAMRNSPAWRLFNPLRQLRDAVMPEGTILRRYYDVLLRPLRGGGNQADKRAKEE